MRKTRALTVIVVGEHAEEVRKWLLPRRTLVRGAAAAAALIVVGTYVAVDYLSLLGASSENRLLRDENAALKSTAALVQDRVAGIEAALDRVERSDAKLRTAVAPMEEPERTLAIGPLGGPGVPPTGVPAAREDLGALPGLLLSLASETERQEASLRELQEYFDDRESLLASTPSIWPTRGWVTSDFGMRLDPVTAERRMHEGLDIATPYGQAVHAPSDGTVVFAGVEGGYGKVLVIDHGYGVRTRYGHLSDITVLLGERVKRGDDIAAVGNSGKSTGPHLHYEVRVHGIPENPRRFVLE